MIFDISIPPADTILYPVLRGVERELCSIPRSLNPEAARAGFFGALSAAQEMHAVGGLRFTMGAGVSESSHHGQDVAD